MIQDQEDQDHQNICLDKKPQVKVHDIISLKIYDSNSNNELDYHLISLVTKINNRVIRLKDIKLIKEPTDNFDDDGDWNIEYNTMQQDDLDTYKFVLLGTKETHPEYIL